VMSDIVWIVKVAPVTSKPVECQAHSLPTAAAPMRRWHVISKDFHSCHLLISG
jgi:hypothetical protein